MRSTSARDRKRSVNSLSASGGFRISAVEALRDWRGVLQSAESAGEVMVPRSSLNVSISFPDLGPTLEAACCVWAQHNNRLVCSQTAPAVPLRGWPPNRPYNKQSCFFVIFVLSGLIFSANRATQC